MNIVSIDGPNTPGRLGSVGNLLVERASEPLSAEKANATVRIITFPTKPIRGKLSMADISEYVMIGGGVIVAAVALQVLWVTLGLLYRSIRERHQYQREANLLAQKIALVQTKRLARQEAIEAWSGWRKFQVTKRAIEPGNICSFSLAPHDGKLPLPSFLPGQYLTFQLAIPDQPKPVVRCYSLSDSPKSDQYRVSIKRVPAPPDKPDFAPGLSSNYFHDHVHEGSILDVRAPSGHFYLEPNSDHPIVLIGGGIGITPVLSMLNTLIDGNQLRREVWFFLGVQNSGDHPFKQHLEHLNSEHEKLNLQVCYSSPNEQDIEGKDYQHAQWVSVDLFKKVLPSSNFQYYMCGPPPMMESLTPALKAWGVSKEQIHWEKFGGSSLPKPTGGKEHKVVFSRSGKTLTWTPNDGMLLDFAENNQVNIKFGCRAGNCGECIVAIKEGGVEYQTDPGAPCEAGSCLTCCSAPKSDLILDV
jgi:ferredoxin-NADP reductase